MEKSLKSRVTLAEYSLKRRDGRAARVDLGNVGLRTLREHPPVLKLGQKMLTPAMQARLVAKHLTFCDVFIEVAVLLLVMTLLTAEPCLDRCPSVRLAA